MIPVLLRTLPCLALSGLSFAEPETKERSALEVARWNVRVDVLMVAVTKDQAPELIWQLQDQRKAEFAAAELEKMLAADRAELIAWPVAWTAGSRATAETVDEVRYSTEDLGSMRSGGGKAFRARPPFHSGVPIAFETRNAGATLEFQAFVHPKGGSIDLEIAPQWLGLSGFRTHHLDHTRGGLTTSVEQPEFYYQKVTTSLTVRSGQRHLLGVFYGLKPDDKVTLFILRAVALPVEPAPPSK